MQLITDLKPLRLYNARRKIYIPFNPENRKKGAMIQLFTRDIRDSINLMNLPFLHNPKLYYSYYMVKNAMAYIDSKGIIDHDAEDPDEAVIEAVMHKMPSGTQVAIDCMGTPHDEERMKEIFHPKKVDKWIEKLGKKGTKVQVTVYGFNSLKDMAKAINHETIIKYNEFMLNSYSSPVEIFVLTEYAFEHSIKKAEIDYEAYCTNELITWLTMKLYHTSRRLANYFGTGLSGQADMIKKRDHEAGNKIKDDIGIALLIKQAYDDRGPIVLKHLLVDKRYTILSKYYATNMINYADGLVRMFAGMLKNETYGASDGESIFNESTGTHVDCVKIFKAMDPEDQKFLSGGYDYIHMPGKEVAYRNVIRGEGILKNLKAFIEVTYDYASTQVSGATSSVIIGVHPKYRREGLAEELVKTMLKEIRKECPEIGNLIWRVDPNNVASQKLAKKCGFKMVRQNNVQYMLRYEFKETPYYRYLDDNVQNEMDLLSYMKKFKIKQMEDSFWMGVSDMYAPIKNTARTLTGNSLDRACLVAAYLDRMGLWNRIIGFLDLRKVDDNGKESFVIVKVHYANVYSYTNRAYYMMDSTISDSPIALANVNSDHFENTLYTACRMVYAKYVDPVSWSTLHITDFPYIYKTYGENPKNVTVEALTDWSKGMNFRKIMESTTPVLEYHKERKIRHLPGPKVPLNGALKEEFVEKGCVTINEQMVTPNSVFFMNEVDSSYDGKIRRYLYAQRLKTNKDLIDRYNMVKTNDPKITKTFLKLELYRQWNLFVDLSYYNNLFLERMPFIKDKAVRFYWDFMERLLTNSNEMNTLYPYQTILIPVSNQAWRVTPGTAIWDYRQNINPISVIFRLLKIDPGQLIRVLGNKRIVFVGAKGYFLVDFSNISMRNFAKLKRFVTKLASNTDINETVDNTEDDEENGGYSEPVSDTNEDTPGAIAMKIVDKVEKSTGTQINDVTPILKTNTIESSKSSITSTIPIMRIQDDTLNIGGGEDVFTAKKPKKGELLKAPENIGIGVLIQNDDSLYNVLYLNGARNVVKINTPITSIISFKK